jgi:hypothetical protein
MRSCRPKYVCTQGIPLLTGIVVTFRRLSRRLVENGPNLSSFHQQPVHAAQRLRRVLDDVEALTADAEQFRRLAGFDFALAAQSGEGVVIRRWIVELEIEFPLDCALG